MKTAYVAGIVVVLVIAAVAVIGLSGMHSSSTTTSSSVSSTTGIAGGGTTATSSTGSQSSQTGTGAQAGTGSFAMLATDPPVASSGVTAATASYDSLAIHSSGSSNSSGWTEINGTGTINLMASASASQTIAAAQLKSGAYDMVRMGIQSASVTYQGKVYAATVASGNITSRLNSDVQVASSGGSAAVIDLKTFVVNTANSTQAQFVFSASAESTAIPSNSTTSASMQVGAQTNLQGSWWVGFKDQTSSNVTFSSATLSSSSLNLQLKDTGNATANIQTVTVTPVSATGSLSAQTLPSSLSGSAVFTTNGSGSLQASNSLQASSWFGGSGTACAAGSSTTLTFSGNISLGVGVAGVQLTGVVAGQQYLVTVMGANTYGSVIVTAQ